MKAERPHSYATGILFTYSSAYYEAQPPELRPTRLSRMAALAAGQVFTSESQDVLIAGEQGYIGHPNTGELLVAQNRDLFLPGVNIHALTAPDHRRLTNTVLQVELLTDYAHQHSIDELQVVAWGFHSERIKRLFRAHDPNIAVEMCDAEDTLLKMDQGELAERMQEFGFNPEVTFSDLMNRGLAEFERRETRTRKLLKVSPKGSIITALSALRHYAGRLDDLTPDGYAIMQTTDRGRHKPETAENAKPVTV